MGKLPALSPDEVIRAFERFGFVVRRRGNHIIMTKPGHLANLSIPNHREVARGTLRSLIKDAGVQEDEFLNAVR
jgi:predicted RNA binding protein YcfA (HicA-like mRNA interferase family)